MPFLSERIGSGETVSEQLYLSTARYETCRQEPPRKRICEGKLIVIYTRPKHRRDKGGTYDDKLEGMEITALQITSDSCIGNMSDIITGFCY